uniref:Uncharacterized protein n=1 Tax=Rhizophora mucronata TaxID=61149 RepID=A0A2P2QB68_RHIMU
MCETPNKFFTKTLKFNTHLDTKIPEKANWRQNMKLKP